MSDIKTAKKNNFKIQSVSKRMNLKLNGPENINDEEKLNKYFDNDI